MLYCSQRCRSLAAADRRKRVAKREGKIEDAMRAMFETFAPVADEVTGEDIPFETYASDRAMYLEEPGEYLIFRDTMRAMAEAVVDALEDKT